MSSSYCMEWKCLWKEDIYALEKKFFAAASFEDFWLVSFQAKQIKSSILWSATLLFAFLEKKKPNKYCLWEVNLNIYMKIFRLMYQSVKLSWKLAL